MILIRRFIWIVSIGCIIAISWQYIHICIQTASAKKLWTDEVYGIKRIDNHTFVELLLKGNADEASPAPLYSMCLLALAKIKNSVGTFGLSPEIYWRLPSIFFYLMASLWIAYLAFVRIKKDKPSSSLLWLQLGLVLLALGAFLFNEKNLLYEVEARSYALWTSLYFVVLATGLLKPFNSKGILGGLLLLALSASAAIFQLTAIAASLCIINWKGRDLNEYLKSRGFITVFLSIIISIYYIIGKVHEYGYGNQETSWVAFWYYWTGQIFFPVLSFLALWHIKKTGSLKHQQWVFMSAILLYCIAPVINYLVLDKGYFFNYRQYLYYECIFSLYFLHLAVALPTYSSMYKLKGQSNE